MLCKKCGKNEATFYYKQNVNGKVTETALCADCASKLHVPGTIANEMSDFFNFNPFAGLFGEARPTRCIADDRKRCPLCGSTFADLVHTGKIGCAKCYEAFAQELAPTVYQLHGKVEHTGRAPAAFAAKNDKKNKLKALKSELKAAIDSQNFEQAAKLRDEINGLEG